jgi:hypothetical protein
MLSPQGDKPTIPLRRGTKGDDKIILNIKTRVGFQSGPRCLNGYLKIY